MRLHPHWWSRWSLASDKSIFQFRYCRFCRFIETRNMLEGKK